MRMIRVLLFAALFACGLGGCTSTDSEPAQQLSGIAAACTAPSAAQSRTLLEFELNGMTRQFRLTTPESPAGTKLAVVLAFHGGGGRWDQFPQFGKFRELGEEANFIFVEPLSELQPPNEGEWILNTPADVTHDIEFVSALLDKLAVYYCVDPKRLYATGYSLGSMFTYELACHLNDRFAAIASYAGTMPVTPISCDLKEPIPIMHLHGTADSIISYDNQWDWKAWDAVGTMMNIAGLVTYWKDKNNCSDSSDTATSSGKHIVHQGCDGGARVEHHRIDGHGHWWPNTIDGVSTHQVIWNFFNSFSKP